MSLDPGLTTFQADPQTYNTPATSPYTIHVTVSGLDGSVTATTSVTVNPVPDEVMIGSLVPAASEYRGIAGEFLVSRAGPTTSNLTVTYAVSGTGLAGTDYAAGVLTGSVTILAGDTSVVLPVDPIERFLSSGYKSVIVTLSSGTGYSVASSCCQALVTIWDDYNPDLSGPGVTKITCFNPNGTESGNYGSAILGDFIPIGINAPSGDYTGVDFTLDYSSSIVVCTGSDGSGEVPSGSTISLYKSYTIYYVFAASATPDDESGGDEGTSGGSTSGGGDAGETPVSGDINVSGPGISGGTTWAGYIATAEFDPLHMLMDGVTVPIDETPATVKVGQKIALTIVKYVKNQFPMTLAGGITWSLPGSKAVLVAEQGTESSIGDYTKGFDPNSAFPQVKNFTSADYKQPQFVFYWVSGGNRTAEADVISSPLSPAPKAVIGTFNVVRPPLDASAKAYTGGRFGFVILRARDQAIAKVGLGRANTQGEEGMLFSHATTPGWDYSFTQILLNWVDQWYDLAGKLQKSFETGPGLDSVFSMTPKSWLRPWQRSDSPFTTIGHAPEAKVVFYPGTTHWHFSADTWLVVKPTDVDSIWVPLGEVHWEFDVSLSTTGRALTEFAATPPPPRQNFEPYCAFPEWSCVINMSSTDPWK